MALNDKKKRYEKPMRMMLRGKKVIAPGEINYKNLVLLKRYITETGKIVPRRITGTSRSSQEEIKNQIKICRILALLPYTDSHLIS